jgi:hypothetical protein
MKDHPAAATALICGVLVVVLVEGPTTADGVGSCEERPWRSGSGSFFTPLVSTAAGLC